MATRLPKLRINRLWVLLIVAILLAIFATWLSVSYLRKAEERTAEQLRKQIDGGPKASVIVPIRDLPVGTVISSANLSARDVATDLVYKDTLSVDQFKAIEGRKLLKPVQQGRPLFRADVFDDRPPDFSYVVKAGMRALTIEIDDLNSISQMLRPGNLIDLHLITTEPGAQGGLQEVFLFMQKVKVIATGTQLRTEPIDPNISDAQRGNMNRFANITIEVTPEEAAYVALAQQSGRIRATLRNVEDKNLVAFDRVNLVRLIGTKSASNSSSSAGGIMRRGGAGTYAVEYFVGGSGSGGASVPINVNVPSVNIAAPPGSPIAVPGVPTSIPTVPSTAGNPFATAAPPAR